MLEVKENNEMSELSNKVDIPFSKNIALWKVFLISLLVSFLFLMICSANSFLYAFNDNQDINWYITVGNGMLNGKVPYKDLFEHKGPIVYYVFAILCSVGNPYINAFFLEVLCMTFFLFFSYKIMLKFTTPFRAIIAMIVLCFIYTTSSFFVVGGGAVEEYCAPIFAWFLLCFFDFTFDKKDFSYFRTFMMGILLGVLFMVKFTLILFPAIILVIWFVLKLKQKDYKKTFISILIMFLAFLLIFILSLIYFIVKDAVSDLFLVYFYDNLFLYKTELSILLNFKTVLFNGFVGISFVILGLIVYIHKFDKKAITYTILVLSYLLLIIVSGNFSYYYQPLLVFASVGLAFTVEYLARLKFKKNFRKLSIILTIVLCFGLCFPFGNATNEMFWDKDDYIHFQIAKDINNYGIENPSLFCYKMWDYGFYNVAGITPSEKYFANNLFEEENFPEMYGSFREAIEQQRNDFVLIKDENYNDEKKFIDQYYQIYKEYSYTYYKNTNTSYILTIYLMTPVN
mgnify:FL=1